MGGTDRLALAAAQAVLDGIGNRADVRLLHDQGLMSQKSEARRIGAAQVAVRHQFMLVEAAVRIDALLICAKRRELPLGHELELGYADPVLACNQAVELRRASNSRRNHPV